MNEDFLLTLSSVHQQDESLQHLIIDGSNGDKVLDFCKTKKLNVTVKQQSPRGIYSAMNFALPFCGDKDIVLYLNSGDFLLARNSLSKVLQAFSESRESPVWASAKTVMFGLPSSKYRILGESTFDATRFRGGMQLMPHPSTFMVAEAVKFFGGFEEGYKIAADVDLTMKVFKEFGPPLMIDNVVTAHSYGGISTVNRRMSSTESRIVRLRNFPSETLIKWMRESNPFGVKSQAEQADAAGSDLLNFEHVTNCRQSLPFPNCCKVSLMEFVREEGFSTT